MEINIMIINAGIIVAAIALNHINSDKYKTPLRGIQAHTREFYLFYELRRL